MGSPSFAVPALQLLLESDKYDVTCVYTKEPRPSGRGKKIQKTPINILADSYGVPVLTPISLKNEVIKYEADLIVVAAYGLLLPRSILESAKHGCINIHPSMLPRWRGAAPIQHTILAGDKETAVCIMEMTEELDAGDILAMQKVEVKDDDNYQTLHDRLSVIGAKLLIETMDNLHSITPLAQSVEGLTYAYKVRKEAVNWADSAINICCRIKALLGVDYMLGDKRIKILQARYTIAQHNRTPGTIINKQLHIACGSGILIPEILQVAGKKPMQVEDFLRGNPIH